MGSDYIADIKGRSNQKIEESREYACEPCDKPFRDAHSLARPEDRSISIRLRESTSSARDHVTGTNEQNWAEKRYYCATCDYSALQQQGLDKRLKTPRHARRVEKAKKAAAAMAE